jgi:tRNA threonylcarbamoyladenosine biosynthesis protein TsaB
MPRLLLAIESATDWLSVALLEDERLLELRRSDALRSHASALLPTIDALLGNAGARLEDLGGLAVSVGPGSFTSLRIGLATAKGLVFGRALPAIGVPTLEAMALSIRAGSAAADATVSEVLALLDAGRGEWYAAGWRRKDAAAPWTPSVEEGLYAPERLAARIEGRSTLVVSPESSVWLPAVEAAGVTLAGVISGEAGRPSAEWVGRWAQRRLSQGASVRDHPLEARYVRRAQAEAQRLADAVEAGRAHES